MAVTAIFGYVQCSLAQPLTPSGMEVKALLGTELVPCQVTGSPYFTTCTTQQIAGLGGGVASSIAAGTPITGCPPLSVLFNSSNVLGCDTALTFTPGVSQIQLNQFGILTSPAAATWQFGALDTSGTTAPTAQTIRAQSASGNAAGENFTLRGSLSADAGTSGDIIFQTGVKSSMLNVQATPTNALVIKGENQQVQVAQGGGLTNAALSIGNSGYGFSEAPASLYAWVGGASVGGWATAGSGVTFSVSSAGLGSAFGQLSNAVGIFYITQLDATNPLVFRTGASPVTVLTLDVNQAATFAGAVVAPLAVIGGLSRKGTVCVSTTNQLYYSATTC